MRPDCVCHGEGWICEEHPGKPVFHDQCPGPGIPCSCNPEEKMPPGTRILADIARGGMLH
jgi:hypothetical protein